MEQPGKQRRTCIDTNTTRHTVPASGTMGSSQKRNGGEGFRELSDPEKPHFFQVMRMETLLEGKLEIPAKFARIYGNDLSSPVILEVPSGAKWSVRLLKEDSIVYFGKGWKEFSDYYGLQESQLVVFKHEGGSHFLVIIFDLTATEIQYLNSTRAKTTRSPEKEKEVLLEPKKEAEEEFPDMVIQDPSPMGETSKKRSSPDATFLLEDFRHNKETQDVKIEMEDNVIDISAQEVEMEMEDDVIDISDDLPMQNPRRSKRKKNVRRHELKGRDNSKIIASRALKASVDFTSVYPYFKLVVEKDYLEFNCVNLPYDFVLRNLVGKKKTLTLKVGTRKWAVEFHRYTSNRSGRLSIGWLQFAHANCLSLGDMCAFELISSDVLKVTIFRSAGSQSS